MSVGLEGRMILFPNGIPLTKTELLCLSHVEANPAEWLAFTILNKGISRQNALINEWRPRLFADPDVAELPADKDALVDLIMARPEYRSRLQADAEKNPPELPSKYNIARFEGRTARASGNVRRGLTRDPSVSTLVLAGQGIDIPDLLVNCILAYVQDLEDWVLGALLGHINQGKKKMIAQYQPVLMADPRVMTFPATEDGLINMITARTDYKTQPEQTEIKLRH